MRPVSSVDVEIARWEQKTKFVDFFLPSRYFHVNTSAMSYLAYARPWPPVSPEEQQPERYLFTFGYRRYQYRYICDKIDTGDSQTDIREKLDSGDSQTDIYGTSCIAFIARPTYATRWKLGIARHVYET
jgi:hypothetical protein